MFMLRILCRKPSQKGMDGLRKPTRQEMEDGVPEWFTVEQDQGKKVFLSRDGQRFDSIDTLKRWRESQVCMDEQPYF
tara:strand:+ start:608 stop:838 length:231 start_codon:yes stop_codon:yes gene_type:complete